MPFVKKKRIFKNILDNFIIWNNFTTSKPSIYYLIILSYSNYINSDILMRGIYGIIFVVLPKDQYFYYQNQQFL